jgi:1-phosphatidylinositol-3-phosphate 5-kinase
MFGCYNITFHYASSGKKSGKPKTQMNLLILENVLYDRQFSKVDLSLKLGLRLSLLGSQIYEFNGAKDKRDLHFRKGDQSYNILRDGDLVHSEWYIQAASKRSLTRLHADPFYLREHSKRMLRVAILNDCTFLAGLSIMDYTMIMGVDSENNELVVGIVGESQQPFSPTLSLMVVEDFIQVYSWDKKVELWVGRSLGFSPEQYKQRMINAVEEYFPLVSQCFYLRICPVILIWPLGARPLDEATRFNPTGC